MIQNKTIGEDLYKKGFKEETCNRMDNFCFWLFLIPRRECLEIIEVILDYLGYKMVKK